MHICCCNTCQIFFPFLHSINNNVCCLHSINVKSWTKLESCPSHPYIENLKITQYEYSALTRIKGSTVSLEIAPANLQHCRERKALLLWPLLGVWICYVVSNAFHAFPCDSSNVNGPYDILSGSTKPGQCFLSCAKISLVHKTWIQLFCQQVFSKSMYLLGNLNIHVKQESSH